MSNVYPLPDRERIYDTASLWVARLDRGLSETETEELRGWLRASRQHREALLELAALWDRMDSLGLLSDLFDPPAAAPRPRLRAYLAMAACLLVAVLGLGLLLPGVGVEPQPASELREQTVDGRYETGVGVQSAVNLPDGTRLLLNTNSQVQLAYSEHERRLDLQRGELHVEVAHEPGRPLRVYAGERMVEAVGTAFNVHLDREGALEVIVTEGKVRLTQALSANSTADKGISALGAGEKLVLRERDARVSRVSDDDLSARLSWREGKLVFRGETLEQALAELARYTPVSFELADDELKQLRIAGLFKAGDVDGLLVALRENFGIDYERVGGQRIVLRSASQEH